MRKVLMAAFFAGTALFLLAAWIDLDMIEVAAQPSCPEPRRDDSFRIRVGSQMAVAIHTDFTDQEEASIKQAFRDWNTKAVENCSGVYYNVDGAQILSTMPAANTVDTQWVGFNPQLDGNVGI